MSNRTQVSIEELRGNCGGDEIITVSDSNLTEWAKYVYSQRDPRGNILYYYHLGSFCGITIIEKYLRNLEFIDSYAVFIEKLDDGKIKIHEILVPNNNFIEWNDDARFSQMRRPEPDDV